MSWLRSQAILAPRRGAGESGVVYKATHLKLHSSFALKEALGPGRTPRRKKTNTVSVARTKAEARGAALRPKPTSFARVYDIGEVEGPPLLHHGSTSDWRVVTPRKWPLQSGQCGGYLAQGRSLTFGARPTGAHQTRRIIHPRISKAREHLGSGAGFCLKIRGL